MTHDLALVASVFGPLFAGLAFHGVCIKFGWLRFTAIPIDGGRHVHGRPLFGANKTARGILAVSIGAGVGYWVESLIPVWQAPSLHGFSSLEIIALGVAIGGAAMLFELPNSFIKRQLGVAPGASATGTRAVLFYILDQVDILVGAWLVVWPWLTPTLPRVLWSVVFVAVVHQLISAAGARLGMRTSAR